MIASREIPVCRSEWKTTSSSPARSQARSNARETTNLGGSGLPPDSRRPETWCLLSPRASWHALWALERGVLRGYLRIEEARLDVRGRIALGRQIARGGGL